MSTKDHKAFGATSGHSVVSKSVSKTVDGGPQYSCTLSGERCTQHDGETITSYCEDHDTVLCNTCVSVGHRSCDGVRYIPKVAGGSKQSKDIGKVKHEISEVLKSMGQTKQSLEKSLTLADEEKNILIKRIVDYTERLMHRTYTLKTAAVSDLSGRHKTTIDTLQSGIRSLNDAETAMKTRLENLDNARNNNDSQVFVDIKCGQQEIKNARHLNANVKSIATGKVMPEFQVSENVEYFLNEVDSLWKHDETAAYKVILHGDYDVSMAEDECICGIHDSCELPDGTILITDFDNFCLKKLDKSFRITECLNLPSAPYGICEIGQVDIAVTLMVEKKVQIVKVSNCLKLSKSFTVQDRCRGICYNRGELFVACGGFRGNKEYSSECPGFVGVYNISGSLLRKIQYDSHGEQIFSMPSYFTVTDNGNKLHVTDYKNGVITIDRQGIHLYTVSDRLEHATGVCAVTANKLLACGLVSNNIVQINTDEKIVGEVLTEKDAIQRPRSVLFLGDSSRLVVSLHSSNIIRVFTLLS